MESIENWKIPYTVEFEHTEKEHFPFNAGEFLSVLRKSTRLIICPFMGAYGAICVA